MTSSQEKTGTVRAEDLRAMSAADSRLKAAKRALRCAIRKSERRKARIERAVRAFTEVARSVRAAQADLQEAQHEYNQAILRAAERVLRT
jgi:hypothetical protein